MEEDCLFHQPPENPPLETERKSNVLRMLRFKEWNVLTLEDVLQNIKKVKNTLYLKKIIQPLQIGSVPNTFPLR